MSKLFSLISLRVNSSIFAGLLFNSFAFKLFIDTGTYNIGADFFIFHTFLSLIITLCYSVNSQEFQFNKVPYIHTLTAWPTLALMLLHHAISLVHLIYYLVFILMAIFSLQCIANMFQTKRPTRRLFFTFITFMFLWGLNTIFQSSTSLYDTIAPLTFLYHFHLVTQGILHIGTVGFMVLMPLLAFTIQHELK